MTATTPAAALPAHLTGTGPGLVLIHGAAGMPEYNFPFIDALATDHTVVAPYLPGTGPAPLETGALDTGDLADRVLASADAAGLPQFVVVGYSLGAAIAIRAAARHPERVHGLVLTAGFAHADPSAVAALRTMVGLLRSGDQQTFGSFMAYISTSRDALAAHGRDGLDSITAMIAASPVPEGAIGQLELAAEVDVRGDLSSVGAPTLVVAPTGDRLVDPGHSAAIAAGIPHARYAEIESGHGIAGAAATAWTAQLRDFLAQLPTGRA